MDNWKWKMKNQKLKMENWKWKIENDKLRMKILNKNC